MLKETKSFYVESPISEDFAQKYCFEVWFSSVYPFQPLHLVDD